MAHPKHRCSTCISSVEGMNLLRTPSEQQALGHRWATNILQKIEGKSPAFTVFCDLRRGGEGLQCDSGYLCDLHALATSGFAQALSRLATTAAVIRALLARCKAAHELLHGARVILLLEVVDAIATLHLDVEGRRTTAASKWRAVATNHGDSATAR